MRLIFIYFFLLLIMLTFPSLIFPSPTMPVLDKDISITTSNEEKLFLYKDYHALIVGVSNYDKWPSLSNSIRDARDIANFFQRIGFKVDLVTDPTSQELRKALNNLAREIGQEPDRGIVFYYKGHGKTQMLPDGTTMGWIIPRDCPLPLSDPQKFAHTAISTKTIETYSQQIRSKHVMMFLDTSFSDNIFSFEPAILKGINVKSASPVRQYIIAGKGEESDSEQSIFKQCLIKGLRGEADFICDDYITGSELGLYLADSVEKVSDGRLHPQYGLIDNPELAGGDFIFQVMKFKADTGRLLVQTNSEDAKIRILNIKPKFHQGMELKPGKYLVEVSAAGYQTKKNWIEVAPGEEQTLTIHLTKFEPILSNSLGMEFILIKPGTFMMGNLVGKHKGIDDEKKHQVRMTKEYYIQSTEVTIGQFRQFIRETGYQTEAEITGGCWACTTRGVWKKKKESSWNNPASWETAAFQHTDRHPVTCVSWNDAQAFIGWLARKEGVTYGLPTEAEWEYACRADTKTPFAYGQCLSTEQANFGGIDPLFSDCQEGYQFNRRRPLQVAGLIPNPFGLFDMHGNVSEWCQSWYGPYPSGPVTDPQGPAKGMDRVMRGGHWLTTDHGCRCAKRWSFRPDSASDAIGFRLVMRP